MSSDVNLPGKPERVSSRRGGRSSVGTKPTVQKTTPGNCPWNIGQRVEARDSHGSWYPAKILDIRDFRLLIHFQRWSSRFDEWFDMDSDLIRNIQEDTKPAESIVLKVGDSVLARWSDSKLYPARIIKFFNDNVSCQVLFHDGYKKKVKQNTIEKLPPDYTGVLQPPKPQPKESFSLVDPTNHNQFVCDICNKGFRKENLLTQHRKHYHNIVENSNDLSVSEHQENTSTPSTSGISTTSETKDDTKVEAEKLKIKISVKVENLSGDEQAMKTLPLETLDTPKNDGIEMNSKKRKGKETRKSLHANPPASASKRPKTEHSVPLSINPYYYYDLKSFKKNRLNLTLPFNIHESERIVAAHDDDNIEELVKCICSEKNEVGLMAQCELCLSWQHALCMGYRDEAEVPDDGYFCPFCRNPPKAVQSQRNSYQLNHWLKNALNPVILPSYYTTISPNSSLLPQNNCKETKIMVKLEAGSSSVFETPNILLSASNPSLFDSYFPSSNVTSFPNSTITSTTTAANHTAISSVSGSNKATAVSVGSFTNGSRTTSDFDLLPSSGLFQSTFIDDDEPKREKKGFPMHHFPSNENDLNMEDDHIDNLIGINLKHDFFPKLMDEDDNFASHVKAANMLSSALLDIMKNIHSLNYKITHHKDVAASQIMEKQSKLKENLKLIETKLEKIEKEIEQKDSYAIHTSSSTLTATSPENFGFSDINCGMGLNNCSFAVSSQASTSHKTSFPGSFFESNQILPSDIPFSATSGSLESQTLSSLNNFPVVPPPSLPLPSPSNVDTSSFYSGLLDNKLLTSSSSAGQSQLLASFNDSSNTSTTYKNETSFAQGESLSKSQLSLSLSSTQMHPPSLARLFIPPGTYSNSNDDQEIIQTQRPSMTHEYLPANLSDAEIKLELAYHYKDLSTAREIVMSLM